MCPKTLFEIIYGNITKQTKLFALTAIWVPYYQKTFFEILEYSKKKELAQGTLPEQIKECSQRIEKLFEIIISAGDPDFIKPEEYYGKIKGGYGLKLEYLSSLLIKFK